MTDNTTAELLARYDRWTEERDALSTREEGDHPARSSQWEASDDEGVALAHELATALRQPVKVWTLTVVDDDRPDKTPMTTTVHATEEECWESLRENFDPEGLADDEPPVAIVTYLEDEQGLTIDIDVQEVARP